MDGVETQNINPVDAGQGGSVDTNIDTNINTNNTPVDGGSEPNANADSQTNAKPAQDKDTNSAFAEMRRAREAAERQASQYQKDLNVARKYGQEYGIFSESDIAENYGKTHGITTIEQFEQALQAHAEAQRMNIAPELYQKLTNTEQQARQALEKLSRYERQELIQQEAKQLENDPKWGRFFNSHKDEIMQVADKLNVNLDTARLLVLDQKYQEQDNETVKQNAIKEYIEKIKNGGAPIESGGNTAIVTGSSTPKTFEEAKKQAMAYLRGTKIK